MPATARTRNALAGTVAVLAMLVPASRLRADIFHLTNGGRIEGNWLNRDEQPRRRYLVETASGVRLNLGLDQVQEAVSESAALVAYEERQPKAADTADAQWALAEWCRKQGLFEQRQAHLRRVLELDPNHQQARYLLGYHFLNGQWITREAFRRGEGYEYYRGKWRTAQEIEILEERARLDLARKEWRGKLRRWRRDLTDPERAGGAHASLLSIKDPVAVGPIGEFFVRERVRRVKMLYAEVLASINTADAVAVLIDRALGDPDEEVYHYCLDRLAQLRPPQVALAFIENLKHTHNARINRAGGALGTLGDPEAIGPLIDALVTTHQHVLPSRTGSADSTTTGFSGDGTIMKHGDGPKLLIVHVRNQAVLDALEQLAGVNFGFDQKAWRYWYSQEKLAREAGQATLDARRQ